MKMDELLARLTNVQGPDSSGRYWAKCPAHEDKTRSLEVKEVESGGGNTRLVMRCHAGCAAQSIIDALDLTAEEYDPQLGYRMFYKSGGKEYEWDWPAMSWQDWQRMMLGLTHGAQMINAVTERGKKIRDKMIQEGKEPSGEDVTRIWMAEADRDAIIKACTLLKTMEKALREVPEFQDGRTEQPEREDGQ